MIHRFFSPDDTKAILSIPLSTKLPGDRLVWAYTPKGNFIVRRAYRLVVASRIGNTFGGASNEENGKIFWKTIWRLNIPNKVKSFAWKAWIRIYCLQRRIYVERKFWLIQFVRPVTLKLKIVHISFGNVIRLVRSGNFLDSHLIPMVWSSMSLWTCCGTWNFHSVWGMILWNYYSW